MKKIESMLIKEMSELKKIIENTEKRLKNIPDGHLRISKKKNKVEYYFTNTKGAENTKSRYMKKNELSLVKKIAQKDYDLSVVNNAKSRLKAIEIFLTVYQKTNLKEIYRKMHPLRRELLDAAIISDEEFIEQWQSVQYEGKEFHKEGQILITEKGEYVRSKSEKIIADKLYMLGIPYRYEYPLVLDENIKVYPDFMILKMPEREEVYLEHFGMMDDAEYVNTALFKLNSYQRNGIYLGVNLFLTYETSKNPLNTKNLDKMLRELFCKV